MLWNLFVFLLYSFQHSSKLLIRKKKLTLIAGLEFNYKNLLAFKDLNSFVLPFTFLIGLLYALL